MKQREIKFRYRFKTKDTWFDGTGKELPKIRTKIYTLEEIEEGLVNLFIEQFEAKILSRNQLKGN